MRILGNFIHENQRLLSFGFLLTFFSCFGQTTVVSLYVPQLGAAFQLSNTGISGLYAAATVGSAFLLPWAGRYVDTVPLMRYTAWVILLLAIALLELSFAAVPGMVLLGFWGIRFGGQGLMSNTAASVMVRGFEANRGKALSLSTLGYPVSEAIMPLVVAFLISTVGWRAALQLSSAWMVVVVLPLSLVLLRSAPETLKRPMVLVDESDIEGAKTVRNPWRLIRGRAFWVLTPSFFLLAFINTAIFFFQVQLGYSRGWDPEWVAGSLSAFAVASACGMLVSGPLVDRFTARKLFPLFLGPYVAGLILLAAFEMPLIYPFSLLFLGLSNGMSSTIKNAVLAEIYGTSVIGSVRSLFTMMTVFSTALGPVTFGLFTDLGLSYKRLLLASAVAVVMAIAWSLKVREIKHHR